MGARSPDRTCRARSCLEAMVTATRRRRHRVGRAHDPQDGGPSSYLCDLSRDIHHRSVKIHQAPEIRQRVRQGDTVDPSEYYIRTTPYFELVSAVWMVQPDRGLGLGLQPRQGWPIRCMRCAKAVLARRRRTRRGRRPLAWADTRCTEPGRPCLWPGVSQGRTVHPSGARPWCTGARESDRFRVPRKPSNTGRPRGPAEKVEGRELAKGNVAESTRSRTPCRGRLAPALSRVRQAPLGACTSTRGRSPVRSCRTPGSVRGVSGN